MRAAVIREFGRGPAVEDVEEARDGAMIGKVLASAITPVDHAVATGRFGGGTVTLPFVTGKEGVAEIVRGGARFAPGTRVYFEFPPIIGGAFAERVALKDDDFIVELPDGVDIRQAAALGGSMGITAWTALEWTAKLCTSDSVLVLGATGPAGFAAVAIAKILGAARVVAAGRNAAALERCRPAGADALVNIALQKERLVEAFREATGGGPTVIFDTVAGSVAQAALDAARPGARLVQIGRSSGENLTLPTSFVAKALNVSGYANFIAPPDLRKQNYRNILTHIERGTIRAIIETRPLADVAAAWEATQSAAYAKFLIEPNS
jgi:NADPH:quinone reductase-like Zn-dependent oxidoreductase